jgi:uncharacterized protein (TIGR00299 family) protein
VPLAVITTALDRLGVGDRLSARRTVKGGITATDVTVRTEPVPNLEHSHDHVPDGHSHEPHGAHHHYRDIRALILGANLGNGVTDRTFDMFDRLARAEAMLHGVALADVVFHEVGAIDSMVDIVGTAAALDWLAPVSTSAAPVAMGCGTVHCAHGTLPVPSPAALEIMREARAITTAGGLAREMCTPTGAAILAATVGHWGTMPDLVPLAIGFGAGDADFPDRPNVLRVTVGTPLSLQPVVTGLYRVEANIDDMSPEMCGHAAEVALAAGALDVWWTPITMKKGRPALQLSALVPASVLQPVCSALLVETTTIGVRFDAVERRILERHEVVVETPYGRIPVKVASSGGVEVNAAPEYEACHTAAVAHGAPLKRVFAAAIAAYEAVR